MRNKLTSIALILSMTATICVAEVPAEAAAVKLNKSAVSLMAGKTVTLKFNNVSVKKAKSSIWSSTNKKVAIVSYRKSAGKATVKAKKKGTAYIKAKYNKKTYKCKVTVTTSIIPANIKLSSQKLAGISVIKNARQLGGYKTTDGYKVKKNLLIRTAEVSDTAEATAIRDTYNLGYIVDLRGSRSGSSAATDSALTVSHSGRGKHGGSAADPVLEGVTNVYAGFSGPDETAANGYVDSLKKEATTEAMKTFLQTVLNNRGEKAIWFHCSKGKDRTGIMAMILLSILRVPEKTIMGDYLLSSNWYSNCNQLGMENAVNYMKKANGSVEKYVIAKTGLTAEDMDTIRTCYRER